MNQSPNQPTLRELFRPVIAHRVLLVIVVALAVGASVAYSATKKPVYQAQASVAYQDESYTLGLVGLAATPTQTADQLASAGAQTIIQPSVATHVKHMLHSPLSIDALTNSVSTTVEPSSNLVDIQASAASAGAARRIANAFAIQGATATNDQVRRTYAQEYNAVLKRLKRQARSHNKTTKAAAQQALGSDQVSRLQELSTIATPAQVVKAAQLPSAPSSPRPVRDAILAGILGLVLGLLAVYVRDAFDRRLRTASDVESQFPFPVLGHVRSEALGHSPHQNGAAPVDWELFRILRRNLDFLEASDAPRAVAVTSSLPEEGKSTVASFLAFASAAAGKRTLLIECDLRRPVLADRLSIKRSPGLSDLVLGDAKPADILQVIPFGDPVSTNGAGPRPKKNGHGPSGPGEGGSPRSMYELVCITAGTPTQHPIEVLRSQPVAELLREAPEVYDLVVLDTSPLLSVADTLELLPQVEAAIVCVRVFKTTRQQAKAGRAALNRLPEQPTGVVVTGTRRTTEAEYGYYGYYS